MFLQVLAKHLLNLKPFLKCVFYISHPNDGDDGGDGDDEDEVAHDKNDDAPLHAHVDDDV